MGGLQFRSLLRPLAVHLSGQLLATAAVALAAAAIGALAAVVDGHAPHPPSLVRIALPAGALVGAAWTLTRWRSQLGDVAVASLGLRPGWFPLLGALLAAGLCAAVPARTPRPGPSLVVLGSSLVATSGEARLEVTWDAEGARRSDTGGRWEALPPPSGTASAPDAPHWPGWAWLFVTPILLALLARGPRPPGLGATLTATSAALAAGYLLGG